MNEREVNQLFGSLLLIGLKGVALTGYERDLLKRFKPRGIVLFARNFKHGSPYKEWLAALKNLLSEVRELTDRPDLIVSIDHEGGSVVRTPPPITNFSFPINFRSLSYEIARATAVELKSLGVNLTWAPVADIHSNPSNPVIGNRAFAVEPNEVGVYVKDYLRGLKSEKILSCAKHFPGHGDTAVDSHFDLPVVNHTLAELEERELIPFKALIADGIGFIMTAHILLPKIDDKNPVTMSSFFLTELLRHKLNFEGVVVSDDLEMKAVKSRFMEQGTFAAALMAGNDQFIIARSPWSEEIIEVLAASFMASLNVGGNHAEQLLYRISESASRVAKVLASAEFNEPYLLESEVFKSSAELIIKLAYS
jgi:beta-N-acetylhexosaminidase